MKNVSGDHINKVLRLLCWRQSQKSRRDPLGNENFFLPISHGDIEIVQVI